MTDCPECNRRVDSIDDVHFIDIDTEDTGLQLSFKAPKRLYIVACANCGAAVGGGVAGAK